VTWPDGTSIQGKWTTDIRKLPAQFSNDGKESSQIFNLCAGVCLFTSAYGETINCDWDSNPVDAVPYDGEPFHKVGLHMTGDKVRLKVEQNRQAHCFSPRGFANKACYAAGSSSRFPRPQSHLNK